MNSKNFLDKILLKIAEAFKAQNPEIFDVAFEIDGKKLYADKLRLSVISSTFKSVLAGSNKNGTFEIKGYKFDDFKEFLTFIYSGECNITDENVYDLLNMAEYYQIHLFKAYCDEYLAKIKINWSNIFQLMETANKYSLTQIRKPIATFISKNFTTFVKQNSFLNTPKMFIEEVIAFESNEMKPEEIFIAVFEWAKHQAVKKEKKSSEIFFDMNDAIIAEMTPFLPHIQFKKMKLSFVVNYVVKNANFLFSGPELSDILSSVIPNVKVKVTDVYGQSLSGFLPYNSDAIEIIKSLKNSPYFVDTTLSWPTESKFIPSTPSSLKKNDRVYWYLVYFNYGGQYIGVRRHFEIDENDYVFAEMSQDTIKFQRSSKCKIEIV